MFKFFHFTEIKCTNEFHDWYGYFYINAYKPLRNQNNALNNSYVPDGFRLILMDQYWTPVEIRGNFGFIGYIYKKYFKRYFHLGYRVNWEKELKKRG